VAPVEMTLAYFQPRLDFGNKMQAWWIREKSGATSIEVPQGKFSEYDAVLDGVRYEFKAERVIERYGNICIEHTADSKPSGISITTADYYVIMSVVDDVVVEWWRIPVSVIKEKIAAREYHKDMRGGYKWLSQFYLFRKNIFDEWRGA
jgi:hypothetical protein